MKNPWGELGKLGQGVLGFPPLNPMQISPLVCLCSRQRSEQRREGEGGKSPPALPSGKREATSDKTVIH